MNLSHTAQSGLTLKHVEGFNVTLGGMVSFWRHYDKDGKGVGPCYPTKTEALIDSKDYAKRAGWIV